jgi:ribosomal protein S18 acetylase RimI-like enzyme
VRLGTALLRQARDWAAAHGLHRLALTVMAHNTRAIRLYERMGFAVEGRRAVGGAGALRDPMRPPFQSVRAPWERHS